MADPAMTKQAALAALQSRATMGRQLLARPIATEADLETLTAARLEWSLANKKLLHQIFGDSAGQVRFAHAPGSDRLALRPRLEERMREFQALMIAQLSDLERLAQMLSKMA